jgi:hypothetical protein
MKCSHCWTVNTETDVACVRCGAPIRRAPAEVPQWAYLFAVLCGIIPVLTLGGAIPVAVGVGGAGGCIKVARSTSLPLAARLILCLAITAGCWLVVGSVVMALAARLR